MFPTNEKIKQASLMKIKIDYDLFRMAFKRDINFHDTSEQSTYLDLSDGHILWVYGNDRDAESDGMPPEENQVIRNQVQSSPDKFLLIPGLTHGQHHDILKAFLASSWTGNKGYRSGVESEYFGSIGGWMKAIEKDYDNHTEILESWFRFKEERIEEMMDEFLRNNGIINDSP